MYSAFLDSISDYPKIFRMENNCKIKRENYMFDFINKLSKNKRHKTDDKPGSGDAETEKSKEAVHKTNSENKSAVKSQGPTYEQWRSSFPKLLSLMADALEAEIPGDRITSPSKNVFVSADVYGKFIDKIYVSIEQSNDGKMTLKIDSGKCDRDILVGEYFFEAGRTKEEIFSFLRSPKMPDILDETIVHLDEKYKNR